MSRLIRRADFVHLKGLASAFQLATKRLTRRSSARTLSKLPRLMASSATRPAMNCVRGGAGTNPIVGVLARLSFDSPLSNRLKRDQLPRGQADL
jgi:hypothetical protein